MFSLVYQIMIEVEIIHRGSQTVDHELRLKYKIYYGNVPPSLGSIGRVLGNNELFVKNVFFY